MPNSYQYTNSNRPPTSAPPAPEWRVPAAPPRPSGRPVASPPPPPPPPSYNPATASYGPSPSYSPIPGSAGANVPPISGFAGVSTASWGVNYNRQNYMQTPPPPLPPRPSSTSGQQPNAQSPIVSPADFYQPSAAAVPSYGGQAPTGDYHQQWNSNPAYPLQQPATSLTPPPPPPPPVPPVVDTPSYQNNPPVASQTQQSWNQPPVPSYHNIPPNYHYPPSTSPSHPSPPPAQPAPDFYQNQNVQPGGSFQPDGTVPQSTASAPPVPPKAGPSVLGSGGPSDWEHLSPTAGDIDDVAVFRPRLDTPVNAGYGLTSDHGAGTPGTVGNGHSPAPSFSNLDYTKPAVSAESSQHYLGQSPTSPGTHYDFQPPAHPVRMDTVGSDYTAVSVIANSENIDGVIEAWNKPISADHRSSSIQQSPRIEPEPINRPSSVQQSPRVEPEPVSLHSTPSPVETPLAKQREPAAPGERAQIDRVGSVKGVNESVRTTESPRPPSRQVDRYDDLDSWSQSSLERYVAMLRKEAVADSDEERFKIFTTFMAKETKLREILYSIEHEADAAASAPKQPPTIQTPLKEPEDVKPKQPTPDESGLIPVETEEGYFAPASNSDDVEDGSYSPGGRPILPRLHTPHPAALHRSASNPGGHKYTASHAVAAHALRSTSVPPNEGPVYSPLSTNPPQRIYTPFKYTEGPQRGSDKLQIERPAYQAYSALRQAQAESGRVMADTPAPTEGNRKRATSGASIQNEMDETFVGLIREKSVTYRKKPPQTSTPPPLPLSLRQGKPPGPVEELRTVTSSPVNRQSESLLHTTVRRDLEKYPNDFSWVRETGRTWEAASKTRKENLDKERVKRQEESESHIDALFNGKEIGYADINILEEEFRQTEARTQLEEERKELEDFISNVYEPVDKRLKEEISTLQVHYDSALTQLDRENSNNQDGADKQSISHTMKIVNEIYSRLEMRHHKRLEIALDRERRRKKAERRPLVFMGDSAALKKLDSEFDQMEKQNVLEAARARDERANRLMDLFDDAIMRGLGENQSLLDELSAKVTRVDEAAIRSSGLPDAEIEQILKSVHSLVECLRKDSESSLHSFGVADSALNNADYSVSVAEARYSNAEPEVFRQLDAEKRKEDAKIQDNLRTKLQSVRVGPAKITVAINDALRILGKTPFPEPPVSADVIPIGQLYDVSLPNPAVRPASTVGIAARKMETDPEHRDRLRKALEDAKKRNAARQRSPSAAAKE
ncbi:uncharacterized protein DSM5745_01342 [Aspergillus mulundensis]|uniref:Uncharacterized protein n=1 Tax=Aspergillus mulundensis TaxID=1810919 RepID=A0A3D8T669_9EURO|nr:hypothetical protein DSM5745_01342 [Aspergillus mulundensis]RDW94020.1 hypothetical protein DSM5745_01342 [Aspergillus mulundensis]